MIGQCKGEQQALFTSEETEKQYGLPFRFGYRGANYIDEWVSDERNLSQFADNHEIHVHLKSLILLHLTSFDHLTSHVTLLAQRAVFIVCICCRTVSGKPNFGSADYQLVWYNTETINHLSVGESGGYFTLPLHGLVNIHH